MSNDTFTFTGQLQFAIISHLGEVFHTTTGIRVRNSSDVGHCQAQTA